MSFEYTGLGLWSSMQWLNPPAEWQYIDGELRVITDKNTDFWRTTHYGFIRDSGHFFYRDVSGDFRARLCFVGRYQDLYDQAGIMVRASETHWLKCGLEFVHGVQYASAVITRQFSDWSVAPLAGQPERVWFEVRRKREAVAVLYSLDGTKFVLLRLADFPVVPTVSVGPVCASPDGGGFEVVFESFTVEPNLQPILD